MPIIINFTPIFLPPQMWTNSTPNIHIKMRRKPVEIEGEEEERKEEDEGRGYG
jgi:phage terminase large subunit-like protein